MTTTSNSSVLKDVIAYVDVWSSDKTANYSKPFIHQLQEMGAQVSKTFNKQVTHVVFNNGHLATWKKAKKSDVRLVSVLWVGRCYDDGVHVDEGLYPALNDQSNPVLKNKKHRCMQPKDSPEKTPENDRRMKKKLDKMMKDLAPKQPLVTDVSPIIIDEENGIVYSPALKRSDYMAQRLKDMRDKRENLSPTASQMVESCSPTGPKPSLGSTPTVKLLYEQSDDDSSASVAEPGYSPHDEGRKSHRNSSENPWLSPCHKVPIRISSPLKCPDFTEVEEGNRQQKSRRTSVRIVEKHKFSSLLDSPCQDRRLNVSKRRSEIKSSSPLPNKSEKGTHKKNTAKSFTDTKTLLCPDAVNSSSCFSSPATLDDVVAKLSDKTATPLTKMEQKKKQARLSISSLIRPLTLYGESKRVASHSTDEDDNVFEDYFSPANHYHRSKRPLVSDLEVEKDIQCLFELDPAPKKRKQRRNESIGSETNSIKKRKLEERRKVKSHSEQSNAASEPQGQESECAVDSPSVSLALMAKKRRQSTLPFTSTSTTVNESVKKRSTSVLEQPTLFTEAETTVELQKKSDASVVFQTLESRGSEGTVAAGLNVIHPEGEEIHNKQGSFCPQNMVNKTKAVRTLVMTSMPTEKQHMVVQVVKALGGFSIVDRVCESTTHVVSGSHRRTLNILLGIARGCWILSFEWILWCLEQRQWVPEEPYELSDQFPAAQICRLQRHLSAGEHQQDLFQGQPVMFVSQHSQPPTQSLVELIQLCGGAVCKTVRQAGICIGKYNGRRPEGNRILSEQWVLDSITHLKKLPYDNYDLE